MFSKKIVVNKIVNLMSFKFNSEIKLSKKQKLQKLQEKTSLEIIRLPSMKKLCY